jgi:hypothetical protein
MQDQPRKILDAGRRNIDADDTAVMRNVSPRMSGTCNASRGPVMGHR